MARDFAIYLSMVSAAMSFAPSAFSQGGAASSAGAASKRGEAVPIPARVGELANLPFQEGRPTAQTAATLRDELLFQRASQVYLWALPVINLYGMKEGSEAKFGAGYNVLPVFKKRLDAKTLITTPNSDVIYALSYLDLGRDGPLVFEAPPGLQGMFLDVWQRPITGPTLDGKTYFGDIGLPGPDKGKGGNFLILPPGYKGDVPDGYYVYRSETNTVFVFLRTFFQDPKDLSHAVGLMEAVKIYPLGRKDAAKAMRYPDASGVPVNMLPRSDATAFEQLQRMLDSEVGTVAGPDWRGMLGSLGILKGKPFKPDDRTRAILDAAAKAAYDTSRVLGFSDEVGGVSYRLYPDRQWVNPFAAGRGTDPKNYPYDVRWTFNDDGRTAVDQRANFFTNYYSLTPGMAYASPGAGAFYPITHKDSAGAYLTGDHDYRLHLPPNPPAKLFWSVTVYDAANSSGLDNGQPLPSLNSLDKPGLNADGSVDLYFGDAAPAGKEKNWLRTPKGKGYFVILRLYGPLEPALNRTWVPGDFEKLN
jgi:hypothetical protein